MSKSRERSVSLLSQYEQILRCPICSMPLKMMEGRSLVCSDNHCFDISKHGYVNLLVRPQRAKYTKLMFESRRILSEAGLFAPLDTKLRERMLDEFKFLENVVKVLDAGCGDGFHLSQICSGLGADVTNELVGVGIDIAKEAIEFASRTDNGRVWFVADLANSPLAHEQFNFILNILSPSNYAEFGKLLATNGLVIKVIPGSQYLRELRSIFYENTEKVVYSNKDTVHLFSKHFNSIEMESVQYEFALSPHLVEPLLNMTPLSWGATKTNLQKALDAGLEEVTVDLTILIGRK